MQLCSAWWNSVITNCQLDNSNKSENKPGDIWIIKKTSKNKNSPFLVSIVLFFLERSWYKLSTGQFVQISQTFFFCLHKIKFSKLKNSDNLNQNRIQKVLQIKVRFQMFPNSNRSFKKSLFWFFEFEACSDYSKFGKLKTKKQAEESLQFNPALLYQGGKICFCPGTRKKPTTLGIKKCFGKTEQFPKQICLIATKRAI